MSFRPLFFLHLHSQRSILDRSFDQEGHHADLLRKQQTNYGSGPRMLNYTWPIPLGSVGRRLSRVLLSYIMSAGRINRPLPYTCLLSARGIISINRNTSARARVLSRSRMARCRRAPGSYDRDENGKMFEMTEMAENFREGTRSAPSRLIPAPRAV